MFASLFLSYATNSSSVYNAAESLYKNQSLAGKDGVFNWDSKLPALPILGVELLSVMPQLSSDSSASIKTWQDEAERYLDTIVSGKSKGSLTKGKSCLFFGESSSL